MVSYTTDLGNMKTADAIISALASPAFVENSQVLQHCQGRCFQPATSNATVRFVIDGNLVGETVAETTAYSLSANSEITQSGVDVTVAKHVNIWAPTVEMQRWSENTPGVHQNIGAEQGRALSVSLNDTFIGLFDDFTNTHTTTASGVLTMADVHDARYTFEAAVLGAKGARAHAVLDRKAINELRKEILGSTASVYTLPENNSLLDRGAEIVDRSYVGSFGSIDFYETGGLPTAGSGALDCGLVFDPSLAFGLAIDERGIQSASKMKLSEGFYEEVASWLFANVGIYRDTAGCQLRSAT